MNRYWLAIAGVGLSMITLVIVSHIMLGG